MGLASEWKILIIFNCTLSASFLALLIIVNFYAVFTLLLIISAGIMMRGILKVHKTSKIFLVLKNMTNMYFQCNPYRLIPFMICLVLGVILGFIQIIRTGWDGVTPAIAWGFWNFYLFVCMLSLYRSLEQERKDMNKFKRRDLTTSRS